MGDVECRRCKVSDNVWLVVVALPVSDESKAHGRAGYGIYDGGRRKVRCLRSLMAGVHVGLGSRLRSDCGRRRWRVRCFIGKEVLSLHRCCCRLDEYLSLNTALWCLTVMVGQDGAPPCPFQFSEPVTASAWRPSHRRCRERIYSPSTADARLIINVLIYVKPTVHIH